MSDFSTADRYFAVLCCSSRAAALPAGIEPPLSALVGFSDRGERRHRRCCIKLTCARPRSTRPAPVGALTERLNASSSRSPVAGLCGCVAFAAAK